jgi:nitrogenase iron protein NifH
MDVVHEFSEMIRVPALVTLPRSGLIQEAEKMGGTVMQHFRSSDEAQLFVDLAQKILHEERRFIPTPIELEDILAILRKHQIFV